MLFKALRKWILDAVYPLRCMVCGCYDVMICDRCLHNNILAKPICLYSGYFTRFCKYEDCVRLITYGKMSVDELWVFADYNNAVVKSL